MILTNKLKTLQEKKKEKSKERFSKSKRSSNSCRSAGI